MGKGYFITATDTGVGKTIISAALIRYFRLNGQSVCAFKPVESGCAERDGELYPEDGAYLNLMAGEPEQSRIMAVKIALTDQPHPHKIGNIQQRLIP